MTIEENFIKWFEKIIGGWCCADDLECFTVSKPATSFSFFAACPFLQEYCF